MLRHSQTCNFIKWCYMIGINYWVKWTFIGTLPKKKYKLTTHFRTSQIIISFYIIEHIYIYYNIYIFLVTPVYFYVVMLIYYQNIMVHSCYWKCCYYWGVLFPIDLYFNDSSEKERTKNVRIKRILNLTTLLLNI